MLHHSRRSDMLRPPDGVIAVLERRIRKRRWLATLKARIDRRQFRHKDASDRHSIENNMVECKVDPVCALGHANDMYPEKWCGIQQDRLSSIFCGYPESLGFC